MPTVSTLARLAHYYDPFLVQSALLGWLWKLPAAKALWPYGPMAVKICIFSKTTLFLFRFFITTSDI